MDSNFCGFFTIQTTTPYNLLWLDYGKYFHESQVLFHSNKWIYRVKQLSYNRLRKKAKE